MAGWTPLERPQVAPRPGTSPVPGLAPGQPGTAAKDVKGWAGKNRSVLLAAGAGGVVLLALVMRNRGGASSAEDGGVVAGTMTTQPQNLGAADSTASDIYNALQPQIENLNDLFERWRSEKDATSTVPVPNDPSTTTPTDSTPKPLATAYSSMVDRIQSANATAGTQAIATPTQVQYDEVAKLIATAKARGTIDNRAIVARANANLAK